MTIRSAVVAQLGSRDVGDSHSCRSDSWSVIYIFDHCKRPTRRHVCWSKINKYIYIYIGINRTNQNDVNVRCHQCYLSSVAYGLKGLGRDPHVVKAPHPEKKETGWIGIRCPGSCPNSKATGRSTTSEIHCDLF